ncbi:hypothetical protein MYSTI_02333 [Myxococcus stipitatus DSM 14675]|uniref:Uncharacterized protein n=1 Tax=Myxococcus stipitatus (strain DSM 14675 / JCM 12634 / Mx s8) TaxID=1278073 RepID=L7UB08_MYXSD|nr:hypothetical protein [Myxococcus stipitatus]AGC43649.1 hypothetical protein MYSTI_02333 [Myxococcus stipitatus DSM 14675]
MFAKLKSQRSMLLSMLLVLGFAALSLGEAPAALTGEDGDALCSEQVSTPPSMVLADSEYSNAACRPTCVGPCWTCVIGVCENRCM